MEEPIREDTSTVTESPNPSGIQASKKKSKLWFWMPIIILATVAAAALSAAYSERY